ncbi:hypothetical protein [Pantoea sp. GD03673]|uniref:hypothetical protein n=1 Tax=Pantoea sp. GD03673 TaxID=2975364 RepID=UPI002447E369|nr:hypothetical protein [Pantoea sp. GD03673]MDH2067024.1 hypothetical protein [Pantoea sp. GD03673]
MFPIAKQSLLSFFSVRRKDIPGRQFIWHHPAIHHTLIGVHMLRASVNFSGHVACRIRAISTKLPLMKAGRIEFDLTRHVFYPPTN